MTRVPKGAVIWLTGVPRSGKSTVARALVDALQARGNATLWLDSDDLRAVLTPNASYSDADRDAFYASVVHLAWLGADGGATVVVSATATKRAYREAVRNRVSRMIEVWVRADSSTLRARDHAGIYRDADAGAITNLPGAGAMYEEPTNPDLVLDTPGMEPRELATTVIAALDALADAG